MIFRPGKEDLSKLDLTKVLGTKLLAKFRLWLHKHNMDAGEGLYYLIWHALAFYEDSQDEEGTGIGISKVTCPKCGVPLVCSVVNDAQVNFLLLDKSMLIFYYIIPPPGEDSKVVLSDLTCPECGEEYDMKSLADSVAEKLEKIYRVTSLVTKGMSAEQLRLVLKDRSEEKERTTHG